MTYLTKIASGSLFVFLAACGGSGSDPTEDFDGVISSGVLENVEIPSEADLATLPDEVANVVEAFAASNALNDPATTFHNGAATYTGTFAFGFDGDNDDTVAGEMTVSVDFDFDLITGDLSNINVFDENGQQIATDIGTLNVNGTTPDRGLIASAQGDLLVNGETFTVNAALEGQFAGDQAARGLGQIAGVVTNPDMTTDGIDGLYVIEK